MTEETVVHIGENSPEQVAFKLLEKIMRSENKGVGFNDSGPNRADRIYILDTYAECLIAVRGYRQTD
ncbi:hypothetical protein [Hirschia baltica]|uniref:Uncharacterized protein n=1 Tax=Hirschia baltica (strain ATCC 49814 / DSM 5838 / IFAM 1418) TaxID=582402 RepID=C6XM87_HIRBI|nr:hypothetical protein [Hirschia baltica]ACT58030.1 hypothetical protein Hbal_0328 [Hirschia baltica ATCC 49814]